ncbi:OmpH family outer membrane protein [Flavobacterium sp. HSC-61S13]|uniref:OmpH family outer membrane protein n=1 Tax=Flavobacterium sp. HSC-61S13 TaxID=2910963 RepID=UPI0020A05632|nr:OmpH family outer membrane protein [Flavobacterium sp. HSC-61S13]MCP1997528.1 outer membrane protein [Flavobacterium sp. HSC-61S13]
MKKMKSLLIAAVVFFGVSQTNVMAQSKTAHIDVQELMAQMPDMKNADATLKKLSEGYEKDYGNMITEYQNKMKKYQDESATASDAINKTRIDELESIQQRIQQFQTTAQQDIQKKQVDLTKPIFEKTRLSIQKVARAKGFEYVLDSSIGSGVIMADGPNLLDDVKKDLGIK